MARVTVDDCLKHVDNRFELVLLAAKRARQLANYGAQAAVPVENDKPTVLALREIALGYVDLAHQEENRVKGLEEEEIVQIIVEDQ